MPTTNSGDLRSPLLSPANKLAGEPQKLCIDDMLQKYCGEFGRWQLRHFVLTSLAWALEAFHTMVMIFADREPDWRCLDGPAGSGSDRTAISVCGLEPGSWEWIGGSGSSTVAQWGLVCGDKFKVGLVQALFFGGCMIGMGKKRGARVIDFDLDCDKVNDALERRKKKKSQGLAFREDSRGEFSED